ncbi:hypothetical protein CANINC_002977 [Pichia inconspicua]|uniref:PH domain-containing protein n=1 Tax=Pichia inconspicua TaxID=52247 RepID=A0A4T0WZT0_9ASCO|nr:hypothetical protein CANINC_002977 [[Candida] inconspicua]
MSIDYNSIHQHLKQLKVTQGVNESAGPSSLQLEEQTAVKYVTILRQDLIQSTEKGISNSHFDSGSLNVIVTLTKVLDYLPKSDMVFALFDQTFFRTLFYLLSLKNLPVEALRGILRICLTYLAGVLPKNRKKGMFKPLLSVLCENTANNDLNKCDLVFENLTSKITFSDARMNLNIVDFVAKVLYRLLETMGAASTNYIDETVIQGEEALLKIIRSLFVYNFFGVLSGIKGIGEIESMTGLRGSLDLAAKWLKSQKVKKDNVIWLSCNSFMEELGMNVSKDNYDSLDVLSLLSLVGVFSQSKMLLKKIMVECNMTSNLPIFEIIIAINKAFTEKKTLNKIFGIWNTDLWYSTLNVSTRCWLFSGAKIENDDTKKVINMINVVIDWIVAQIDQSSKSDGLGDTAIALNFNATELLEQVDNFSYEEIKTLQLDSVRSGITSLWKDEMKVFDNMLHNEVIELVSDRKFLQLSKGSWVYCQNPLQVSETSYMFITLNANSQSIVYKEFPKKPTKSSNFQNLDKDGIMIEFKNITGIECENMNPQTDDSGLVILRSERMDVNKVEVFTKTGSLIFYVHTKELKDAWVDGLRILVSESKSAVKNTVESTTMKQSISEQFFTKSGVTKDVKKQVRILEDVRFRTQLLYLDNPEIRKCDSDPISIEWEGLNGNFTYD